MATRKTQHTTTDLVTRLDAKALQEAREHGTVRARIRSQVASLMRLNLPKPTGERNREGYVRAMYARREPVYAGTVSPKVVARRRARNRMARASRRANRG